MGKDRYFVTVQISKIYTATSGDGAFANKGEFFLKFNKSARFPTEGHFKLSKDEGIDFDGEPVVWTAVLSKKDDPFKLNVRIMEEDKLSDDKMAELDIAIAYAEGKQEYKVVSEDEKVYANITVKVVKKEKW
jgi:hypothetical protein